ncbi:MAG: IclR family transcriptional regulator [Zhengella sp.]|uniref:IclR family transcriptional regulator n=1 Tax=Zhengella sp. TaxID=2282762 RepID=UPI00352871E3
MGDTAEIGSTQREDKDPYLVPALQHGLKILMLFSRERPVLGAPDIVRQLGLPRASAFRLLHTLEQMNFLVADGDRKFRLGPAVLGLGFGYLVSDDLVDIAQPILRRLRDQTGLSSHMAVLDGKEVVYVIRHAARSTIASSVQVGTRFPVHATVMGRMLICDLTQSELRAMFPDDRLPAFTPQTPKTVSELAFILRGDRERGYAVSQSFFEKGVCTVAAPVRDGFGQIVASINVTAVDSYVDEARLHGELKDAVLEAARMIGLWLSPGGPGLEIE